MFICNDAAITTVDLHIHKPFSTDGYEDADWYALRTLVLFDLLQLSLCCQNTTICCINVCLYLCLLEV